MGTKQNETFPLRVEQSNILQRILLSSALEGGAMAILHFKIWLYSSDFALGGPKMHLNKLLLQFSQLKWNSLFPTA